MSCCNKNEDSVVNISNIFKPKMACKTNILPRIASFLLRPIADFCNLDCKYCYFRSHTKTVSWDSDLTIKIMYDIAQYVKKTDYPVRLTFHGGEPMLAGFDFFKEAVNAMNTFKTKYKIEDNKIRYIIQTNATLINQKWCDFFKEEKFGIGVSFDIMEDVQNKERSNSYKRVVNAMNLLRKNNIRFGVNSVLSERLIACDPKDVLAEIVRLKIKDFEFSPMSWKDRNHKEYNDAYAKFMIGITNEYLAYDNPELNLRFIDSALKQLIDKKSYLCTHSASKCGVHPTIDAYGNFHFCDNYDEKEYLVKDVASLKKISLIEAVQIESYQNIRENPRLYSDDCATCDVSDLCQGGCPGNFDNKLKQNIFCSAYKQIFRHIKNTVGETVDYLKINV